MSASPESDRALCTAAKRRFGRVEDGRGSLGHAATPRFPSPLIERSVRISRTKCGRPHLLGNVASAFMWRPTPLALFNATNRALNAT